MSNTLPFWVALLSTVVLIAASLWTGLTRRRRVHLWLGPLTMVSLGVAVVLTEQLVRQYDFPADVLRTHLWFAKAGGFLALPVIVTGLWLWRSESARTWHKIAVYVWIASVLTATGTGLWMFTYGTLRAA